MRKWLPIALAGVLLIGTGAVGASALPWAQLMEGGGLGLPVGASWPAYAVLLLRLYALLTQ